MRYANFTEEFVQKLLDVGLTRDKIDSKTAQAVFDALNSMEDATLRREMQAQIDNANSAMLQARSNLLQWQREAAKTVAKYNADAQSAKAELERITVATNDARNAEEEYRARMSDEAKDLLMLYSTMLDLANRYGASLDGVSYVLYAYCGGQAKREIYPAFRKQEGEPQDKHNDIPCI